MCGFCPPARHSKTFETRMDARQALTEEIKELKQEIKTMQDLAMRTEDQAERTTMWQVVAAREQRLLLRERELALLKHGEHAYAGIEYLTLSHIYRAGLGGGGVTGE